MNISIFLPKLKVVSFLRTYKIIRNIIVSTVKIVIIKVSVLFLNFSTVLLSYYYRKINEEGV